ncbi:ankyrin repeat domain-containing protein [Wolbachia endosymbiont (group E) of Neria commutata]|uniref:ankyrin repeat domain-containing protein n=1 Tax=Wolbachia endosymbiont (group E) of Neria commutata TaxID=3066149 RepID=UPI00313319D4
MEITQRLLKVEGIDINRVDKHDDTPLHMAASCDNSGVITLLLERGADVNAKNGKGRTPLIIAADNGRFQIVEELLKHNPDVNHAEMKHSYTALHAAVTGYSLKLIKILLECENIDVNIPDKNGLTPLHLAVQCDCKEASQLIIQHLVKGG